MHQAHRPRNGKEGPGGPIHPSEGNPGTGLGPILVVSPWYPTALGGVTEVAERLRVGLGKAGVDVHLLVAEGGRELVRDPSAENIWSVQIPSYLFQSLGPRALAGSAWRSPPTVRRIRRFVREKGFRVAVLLYPIEFIWPFVLLRRTEGLRIVTSLHGNDVECFADYPPQLRWLVRQGLRLSDSVVVCASHLARISQEICPEVRLPTRLIPNGVDVERFTPPPPGHRRGDPAPTVVHVSNFAPKKRTGDIVDAFARADLPPGARLVMVGDGPTLAGTREKARGMGVAERVEFVGIQSDIRPFLWDADVFALASDSEGAPLVLLEAMACGVPWVSTAWGAAADLPPGECGLVVPAGAPEHFSQALSRILHDHEDRRRMSRRARERAVADYSLEAYVDEHVRVLREVQGMDVPGEGRLGGDRHRGGGLGGGRRWGRGRRDARAGARTTSG
jgi:glycosyltransferase involved in cell wall biosynthesis